nr:MAG TPA: protein of unknown function (DUF5481) [Caudoviricetes sp.]
MNFTSKLYNPQVKCRNAAKLPQMHKNVRNTL